MYTVEEYAMDVCVVSVECVGVPHLFKNMQKSSNAVTP